MATSNPPDSSGTLPPGERFVSGHVVPNISLSLPPNINAHFPLPNRALIIDDELPPDIPFWVRKRVRTHAVRLAHFLPEEQKKYREAEHKIDAGIMIQVKITNPDGTEGVGFKSMAEHFIPEVRNDEELSMNEISLARPGYIRSLKNAQIGDEMVGLWDEFFKNIDRLPERWQAGDGPKYCTTYIAMHRKIWFAMAEVGTYANPSLLNHALLARIKKDFQDRELALKEIEAKRIEEERRVEEERLAAERANALRIQRQASNNAARRRKRYNNRPNPYNANHVQDDQDSWY